MFKRQFPGLRKASTPKRTSLDSVDKSGPEKADKDETKATECICNRKPQDILCKACGYLFTGRVRRQCPIHFAILLMDFVSCPSCKADQLLEVKVSTTPPKATEETVEQVLKEWRERRPSKGSSQQPVDDEEEDWDIRPAETQSETNAQTSVIEKQAANKDVRPAGSQITERNETKSDLSTKDEENKSIDHNQQASFINAANSHGKSSLALACMKGIIKGIQSGSQVSNSSSTHTPTQLRRSSAQFADSSKGHVLIPPQSNHANFANSGPVETPTPPSRRSLTQLEVGISPDTIIRKTLFLKKTIDSNSASETSAPQAEAKFNIVVHSTGKVGDRFSNNVVDMDKQVSLGSGDAVVNSRKMATDELDSALAAFSDLHIGVKR